MIDFGAPNDYRSSRAVTTQSPHVVVVAAGSALFFFPQVPPMRENRGVPFFLYLAHLHVHVPHYAPERFMKNSKNGAYGAVVEEVDWTVNVLFDELKRLGIDDRTLVLFTSDNGGAPRPGISNAPLRGHKGTTWEGGMRVPCIARWPGTIPAGTECAELITSMDFLPTFAVLAGASVPEDRTIDGREVRPLLLGEPKAKTPHEKFCYYRNHELQALRKGKWKLHLQTGELYDLEEDIGESDNVAASHPEVVEDLRKTAAAVREDLGDSLTGVDGAGRRPCGRIENPRPLTTFAPDHPYMIAMYD